MALTWTQSDLNTFFTRTITTNSSSCIRRRRTSNRRLLKESSHTFRWSLGSPSSTKSWEFTISIGSLQRTSRLSQVFQLSSLMLTRQWQRVTYTQCLRRFYSNGWHTITAKSTQCTHVRLPISTIISGIRQSSQPWSEIIMSKWPPLSNLWVPMFFCSIGYGQY